MGLLSSNRPGERGETPYLSIATSLQHLVGRVSGMRLVGNEVGALYLVDGLNLGESCQVFVIKDLIIHFSLGRRRGTGKRQRDKRERRGNKNQAQGKQASPVSTKNRILGWKRHRILEPGRS